MIDVVQRALVWLPLALVVAAAMDLWAMVLHGRVWHHKLWPIHVTHHRARDGRFELNDALSVLHAPIAIALILYGARAAPSMLREVAFGVGIGMSIFGLAYILVHDGLVHRRLPVRQLRRLRYLARVARAHRVHHATGGPPYGLFFGPWELARAKAKAARAEAQRPEAVRPSGPSDEPTTRGSPARSRGRSSELEARGA